MTMLRLGQAARLAGVGKSRLTRAIRSGKLCAIQRADGRYEIDSAEVCRLYERQLQRQFGPSKGYRTAVSIMGWLYPPSMGGMLWRRSLS